MEVGLLYSGGKDSTLAAVLLEPFCEVTLLCGTFGITDDHEHAQQAASAVGFPSRKLDLDPAVARQACTQMLEDGYPKNGIQQVHEHAIDQAASLSYDAVADGTRRDDRVPTVSRPFAQSVEDRYGVSCITPLSGFGRDAIDSLAQALLTVESKPSETLSKGDYEAELRAHIRQEHGPRAVSELFPDHVQSRVTGRQERPDR